jgi:Holliday junction resolvase RusA-like endonuclease
MISIKFTVYGKPQGKARPRFTRQGRAYTPKNTVDYEKQIKQAYIAAGGTLISDTFPIQICITACFKKAKSNKMQFPTLKPDTDNIAKVVCDALNGVAYHDDKQITSLTVDKVWADDNTDKVVIEIEELIYP